MLTLLRIALSAVSLWAQSTSPAQMYDTLAGLAPLLSSEARILNGPLDDEFFPVNSAYYNATELYNAAYVSRPRAVISCVTTQDVANAVVFLNTRSLPFRIHSSGHNLAGYSGASCAEYLIDLTGLRRLERGANGTTIFGPGIMSFEVFQFLIPYREVVVSCDPHLHAIGMILVGGISELTPVQGTSTDLAVELEVVTANGTIVNASATQNSDLFYALRGAGSNSYGVVTAATIRAVKVPKDMGKGRYALVDRSKSPSEANIQAFIRGYRDELILSNRSGVSSDMGVYLTLRSNAKGRGFFVDWTYFGNDMANAKKGVDAWVRRLAASSNLNVTSSTQASATYEEYVATYVSHVENSEQPEQWLSPFMSGISDDTIASFTNLTSQAVKNGANSAIILILAQQVNGRQAGIALKGREQDSAFPFRSAKLWFLDMSSCPFSDLNSGNACVRFVQSLYNVSKRDTGYLGLYHGIQNRILEAQPDFLDDYFGKTANPARWRKLMDTKRKWDPENKFCAPQSVIPCTAPSADTCVARGLKPVVPTSAAPNKASPGQVCSVASGCTSGFSCQCFSAAKAKLKAKSSTSSCFCVAK